MVSWRMRRIRYEVGRMAGRGPAYAAPCWESGGLVASDGRAGQHPLLEERHRSAHRGWEKS
jgi:hypothetical protein